MMWQISSGENMFDVSSSHHRRVVPFFHICLCQHVCIVYFTDSPRVCVCVHRSLSSLPVDGSHM